MKSDEIQIRDPFIFVNDGVYYLYGSTDADIWKGAGRGFTAYKGTDLENWQCLGNVFDRPEGYWGTINFWAPEMHAYNGSYYLFASFKAEGVCRGTAVLKSDSPEGPFRPWSSGAVTPKDWECLDGTLYVEDGKPYIIFCHEWVQIGDGEICLMPLTDDLSAPAGEPVKLFSASEAKWPIQVHHRSSGRDGYVTDGPNMLKTEYGLFMLWSSKSASGYAIGTAKSETGKIAGPWRQIDKPVFDKDGGHGMVFKGLDGKSYLTIHTPNHTPDERPIFIQVEPTEDGLKIKGK